MSGYRYGLVRDESGLVHRIIVPENTIQVGVVACLDWFSFDLKRARSMASVAESQPPGGKRCLGIVGINAKAITCLRCFVAELSAT